MRASAVRIGLTGGAPRRKAMSAIGSSGAWGMDSSPKPVMSGHVILATFDMGPLCEDPEARFCLAAASVVGRRFPYLGTPPPLVTAFDLVNLEHSSSSHSLMGACLMRSRTREAGDVNHCHI